MQKCYLCRDMPDEKFIQFVQEHADDDPGRLLLSAGEPVADIVKVYRAALDGGDFRALPQWQALETMNTTAGHYFRGVE